MPSPRKKASESQADRELIGRVARWFGAAARDLPWRTSPRDPYRSLVSELMLQQTQVARVLEKFDAFLSRFPTVRDLAGADECDVLAAWSGLGYYRRARLLHAAARAIVESHDGHVPREVEALRSLPGLGRYTAGAIASIVFGRPAPIVDGNVARVLLRLSAKPMATDEAMAWAWKQVERLVTLAHEDGRVAAFNEGLMELGATICTPSAPCCDSCPIASLCLARAKGKQGSIPKPKAKPRRKMLVCEVVVVRDRAGRLLVERRGLKGKSGGMWGGLWQAPTYEHAGDAMPKGRANGLAKLLALPGVRIAGPTLEFEHITTHRRVLFRVRRALVASTEKFLVSGRERRWVTREEVAELALSNPQRRVLLGDI